MENINEIDAQIKKLESKKTKLQEAEFKEASKHWFTLMNAKYESSSMRTPQYLTFCRVFKRQFKKLLMKILILSSWKYQSLIILISMVILSYQIQTSIIFQ